MKVRQKIQSMQSKKSDTKKYNVGSLTKIVSSVEDQPSISEDSEGRSHFEHRLPRADILASFGVRTPARTREERTGRGEEGVRGVEWSGVRGGEGREGTGGEEEVRVGRYEG